jgi:hypothetical protein
MAEGETAKSRVSEGHFWNSLSFKQNLHYFWTLTDAHHGGKSNIKIPGCCPEIWVHHIIKHNVIKQLFAMTSTKSQHILSTSSNLLGFCLIVLTSLKISNYSSVSIIDECTGVATIFLMASSLFSFLCIRSKNEKKGLRYEAIADIIFIVALLFIFSITFLVAFSIIF